jgi:hypothetical protein
MVYRYSIASSKGKGDAVVCADRSLLFRVSFALLVVGRRTGKCWDVEPLSRSIDVIKIQDARNTMHDEDKTPWTDALPAS